MIKGKNKEMTKIKHFNPMALREKYTIGSPKRTNPFSSFWADNDWDTRRTDILDDVDVPKKKGVDHIKLASYRRAISNFVTIVTNQSDIPVRFQSNDNSYTDGKVVTIGSKIDEKNFDPVVGLALHEGSHIKLSNFDFLRNLDSNIPQEIYLDGEKVGFGRYDVMGHIKSLLNYVEDRRIDYYVFSNSPGYKGYYHSMYDKYFHSNVIDKALLTDSHTSLDWDSYIMRILNLTNKNRRLDVLPNLDKIYNLIFGGGRVKKLTSTEDAFNVAVEIYRLILDVLPPVELDENGNPIDTSGMESSGNSGGGDGSPSELTDEEFQDMLNGNPENVGGGSDGGASIEIPSSSEMGYEPSGTDSKGNTIQLTPKQQKQLMNHIEKQKDFNNGDAQKVGKLTKKDSAIVKTMEEAGVENVKAGEGIGGKEYSYERGEYLPGKGTDVIYVKKLTQTMIDENLFPSVLRGKNSYYYQRDRDNEIMSQGISLGTKLGRKLQVRGESRDLKWNRLDSGKIDKRLIAELGFGNERVFSTTFVDKYSDAFLHISVDASGSMGGDKWNKTMISTIAICKAIDMIQGVDVMVSFRSTHESNGRSRGSISRPLILVAYDSRVDKFSKVKKMFPNIYPGGTTPEGLCFEAIMKDVIPTSNNRDSYFLNISDGMPMFSNSELNYYSGDAVEHTRTQVDNFRKMGIKVLSYFVSDSSYGRDENVRDFKRMYGKDAEMIDLSSVVQISKTMNDKFLEKN